MNIDIILKIIVLIDNDIYIYIRNRKYINFKIMILFDDNINNIHI